MTETVVVAPLLVALSTAVLALLVRRSVAAVRAVSLVGGLGYAVAVAALVRRVALGAEATTLTYQVGNWPAPFGISLVADPLAAFMLAMTAAVAVPSLVHALRSVSAFGQRLSYHALFHFMLVGVTGAFLTGDVFNLFVWFEVMLMASYVLVAFGGDARATRAAFNYLALNLVGSALMLLAVGGLYATTGTLNMAHLARRLADPAAHGVALAPALGLSALLVVVFALKAGLVPFQFWVPAAYRAAPAPATAMLAGVTKKVGVYAIVRLLFTVLAPASFGALTLPGLSGGSALDYFGPALLAMAGASIVLGGVGAVARHGLDGVLAYSSISQVGFIVLPLAVGASVPSVRHVAVTAALVYALAHALAKALLFLTSGTIERGVGTADLDAVSGLAGRSPLLAGCAFAGLLALVGIPPLVGFFGKLFVFRTAVAGGATVALALALGGAVLSIAYVSRTWNRGFWGEVPDPVATATFDRVEVATLVVLAVAVVAVGVGFDPVFGLADRAATAALDWEGYAAAVLGSGGGGA